MEITPRVAMEVAHHEGIVRQAYRDSVGVWTWSVGLTDAAGLPVEQYIDAPQPLRRCLEAWLEALERYAEDVRLAFAGHELAEHEFAAALSFHWNTGAIGRAQWVQHWKAGDRKRARRAILNWKSPPEIIPRRRAERDLFFDGVWEGDGRMTEYTRVTASYAPDWSSARKIDVGEEIAAILGGAPEGAGGGQEAVPGGSGLARLVSRLLAALRRALTGSGKGGRNA